VSKLSVLLDKLTAARQLADALRAEWAVLGQVLSALEEDDHRRAWEALSASPQVAEVMGELPPEVRHWLELTGPVFMALLDAAIDERAIRRALSRLGLS